MADISVDFDTLRLSVLRKAVSISSSVNHATLGPNSSATPQNSENNKNSANISPQTPPKTSKSLSPRPKNFFTFFSMEKIRHENEVQRREEVRRAVDKRKHEMEAFEQKLQKEMATMRVELATKREQDAAAEKAKLDAEEERFAQQDEIKRRHEAQLQTQRIQERKEKLEREADEHRKLKLHEHEECLQTILTCKLGFTDKCREITQLAESVKNRNVIGQVIVPFMGRLREMKGQLDGIGEGARTGGLTRNDVRIAEEIVREAEEIVEVCKIQVNEMFDEYWRREVQEAEALADARARANAHANAYAPIPEEESGQLAEGQLVDGVGGVVHQHADTVQVSEEPGVNEEEANVDVDLNRLYLNSKTFLEQYQATYKDLGDDDQRKCTTMLSILIKGISPMDGGFLKEIIRDIQRSFEAKGAQERAFCKNYVAETLVDEVHDWKDKRIYAVAAVVVALWFQYPDFGDLVLSHLHMKCPYTIPVILPRLQGQSDEDFYKSRGWSYTNRVREIDTLFCHRMETFMRFYAAIIITKLPKTIITSHPHGLGNAWRWLATVLNSQPQYDGLKMYARLIRVFLEETGDSMFKSYPNQFPKLLKILAEDYYKFLVQHIGDNNHEIATLNGLLSNVIVKNNRGEILNIKPFPPAVGQLPPNFW